jgi:hypothetical protein
MSEDFECDFSDGSLNEKRAINKKRQSEKVINMTHINSRAVSNVKNIKMKENIEKFKSSKLSKKNLQYFLIYYDGNLYHTLIRNILNERKLEISSDVNIDMSKNVYFMLIDFQKEIVEGIFKKDYVRESSDDLTKKKIYKLKLEIKSR